MVKKRKNGKLVRNRNLIVHSNLTPRQTFESKAKPKLDFSFNSTESPGNELASSQVKLLRILRHYIKACLFW